MAISKEEYRTFLAERIMQMFALKTGFVPAAGVDPGAQRANLIRESFALADDFIKECSTRSLKPWDRESL